MASYKTGHGGGAVSKGGDMSLGRVLWLKTGSGFSFSALGKDVSGLLN